MSAGGNTLLGKDSLKLLQFSFAREMSWKRFEIVAISPEPAAVAALGPDRKMLAPNHFSKSMNRLVGIHLTILIHEQLVVY